MANPTITITDEGLIPGADYSLAQLQRIDALLTTIERKAAAGFNRNMPAKAQQLERQHLSNARKELSGFGIEVTGTLKEMGRIAQQIQPQIRAAVAQMASVQVQAGRAAQAVQRVGEAAKVAGSMAATSKGKDRMRGASQALEQADKAIAQKARETQARVVQSLEQVQKGARQAVVAAASPLGMYTPHSPYRLQMGGNKAAPYAWDTVQAVRSLAQPRGHAASQVRAHVQSSSLPAGGAGSIGGKGGAKLPGSGGGGSSGGGIGQALLGGKGAHSLARGVAGAGNALFLTYGSVPHLVAAYAASSAVKNSISNFAELDQQLRHSRAVSEDYGVSINKMMESVLKTSKRFAAGQREVAEALQALTQAGVGSGQALAMVNDVMALAATGDMDARQAAVTLAGTTQAFGLSFAESTRVADVFAKAAAVSSASVESITEAMKRASTVVRGYGVEVEDVGAAMAVLGKLNITGSPAGTAYMNLIQDLAAPNSNKHKRAQAVLGVDFYDKQSGAPRDLMREIIPQMRNELAKYDKETQASLLRQSVNTRSFRLLKALLDSSQKDIENVLAEMQKAQGYTMEVAYAKNDNLLGDWKKLIAGFNATLTEAGSKSNDAMRKQVQEVSAILSSSGTKEGIETLTRALVELGGRGAKALLSLAAVTGNAMSSVASLFKSANGAVDDFFLGAKRMEHIRFAENLQKQAADSGKALAELAKQAKEAADQSERAYQAKLKGETYNANIGVAENAVKEAEDNYNAVKADVAEKRRLLESRRAQMPAAEAASRGWAMGGLIDSPAQRLHKEIKDLEGAIQSAEAPEGTLARAAKIHSDRQKGLAELRGHYERKAEADRKTTQLEVSRRGPGLPQLHGDLSVDDAYASAGVGGAKVNKVKEKYTFEISAQGLLRDALADSAQGVAAQYGSPFDGNFKVTSGISKARPHPVYKGVVRPHNGVDVGMPSGTPLKAMADGHVEHIGWNPKGYGKYLDIRHSDGTMTRYAHLSKIAADLAKGAQVMKGQQVALSGNTGASTGPHLHMEVHRNGKLLDYRNVIGTASGASRQTYGLGSLNALLEADKPDDLVRKIGQRFDHIGEQLKQAGEAAERSIEQRYMSGQILTSRDRDLALAQITARTGRESALLDRAEADNYQRLIDRGELSSQGRFEAERARDKAQASAARKEFDADKALYDAQAGREYIDSLRQMAQGHDDLLIKEQMTYKFRQLEAAQQRELVGMSEQGAFIKRAQIEATSDLRKELEQLTILMEMVKSKGLDKTDEGRSLLSAGEGMADRLRGKIKDREAEAARGARKDFLEGKGRELSSSFAQALTSENASRDIRRWIVDEVLAKPFKMQIEMLMRPMMEQIASLLFPTQGGGGSGGVLGWVGKALGFALDAFGGSGAGSAAAGATSAMGTSFSGAAFNSSLYGFANGGIMTNFGPLPLRKYAKGGIANSPQLALYGEGSKPEAYVPLPDGRTIPVTMSGGEGYGGHVSNSVSVTINQHANGSSDSESKAKGNGDVGQFGKYIAGIVQQEMVKQMRSGGMLAGRRD